MLALQALAQSAAPSVDTASTTRLRGGANETRAPSATVPTTLAANTRVALPAPVTRTVNAAGSVLVLVDGIVTSASIAPVPVPAPGFVYER